MVIVKVFVRATNADTVADTDARAMTQAPKTFLSQLPKKLTDTQYSKLYEKWFPTQATNLTLN